MGRPCGGHSGRESSSWWDHPENTAGQVFGGTTAGTTSSGTSRESLLVGTMVEPAGWSLGSLRGAWVWESAGLSLRVWSLRV